VAAALKKADDARGQASKPIDISQVLPPTVRVTTSAKPGTALKDGQLKIEAVATAAGTDPITALQLLIDDRPYTGDKGLITLDRPDKDRSRHPGRYSCRRGSTTFACWPARRPAWAPRAAWELVTEPDKPEPKTEPTLYVLAIGIDAYADKGLTLGGAVKRCQRAGEGLQATQLGLCSPRSRPGCSSIRRPPGKACWTASIGFKQHMTAADLAVFFYAGHGDLAKGEFYLLHRTSIPGNWSKRACLVRSSRSGCRVSLESVGGAGCLSFGSDWPVVR